MNTLARHPETPEATDLAHRAATVTEKTLWSLLAQLQHLPSLQQDPIIKRHAIAIQKRHQELSLELQRS